MRGIIKVNILYPNVKRQIKSHYSYEDNGARTIARIRRAHTHTDTHTWARKCSAWVLEWRVRRQVCEGDWGPAPHARADCNWPTVSPRVCEILRRSAPTRCRRSDSGAIIFWRAAEDSPSWVPTPVYVEYALQKSI